MRRQVIGYNQALQLLRAGQKMAWGHYPVSRAAIDGKTIHYKAFLKLTAHCRMMSDNGNLAIYTLNEEVSSK